jgi:hypothetical protein
MTPEFTPAAFRMGAAVKTDSIANGANTAAI